MDPLGLGRDLFRLAGLIYWGLALLLFCVALTKPKRPMAKVAWTAVVVGIFTSPLLLGSFQVNRVNAAHKDSCSRVRSSINPIASGSSQFVDHELVWLGRKSPPYVDQSIRYMLERKLAVLELSYDPQFWRDLTTRSTVVPPPLPGIRRNPNSWGVQAGTYVRLTLQDAGHEFCEGFQRWANQYPSQKWPWMQKLGLRPDQCIGFELANRLQSRYGIYVERVVVERNGNNGALEGHRYRLHDHESRSDLGTAFLSISSVYEHRDVLCGGEAIAIAKQLPWAIQSTADPRYAAVDEVKLNSRPFPVTRALSIDELRARELNAHDRSISFDRRVWTEPRYERKDGSASIDQVGYELVSMWGDRLYRIPLDADMVTRDHFPKAVGANASSVVVLLGHTHSVGAILLEFSRTGEARRQQRLTASEMQALGLP